MKSALKYTVGALVLALVLALSLEPLRSAYEVASLYISPSAQRAYAYAERHFDARDTGAYDVDLAEYFFWRTRRLDPKHPYVHHELSRIEFLRGNFDTALVIVNTQIALQGAAVPNSYYVRGLIQGYRGDYDASARDYKRYLEFDPTNWAARNDLAWALLKAGKAPEAHSVTAASLVLFPDNAWLWNTHAIALFELGEYETALKSAEAAVAALANVTEKEWLTAYPGNDPKSAAQGIGTLRQAIENNMHMAADAIAGGAVQ